MRNLTSLRKEGSRLLRAYIDAGGDRERTPQILRDLAAVLVDMREHFVTDSGEPDWTGRSYGYRQAVQDLYADASVPPDERNRIQSSVRYHVGAVLRERLDDETLESLGIQADSPMERSRAQRAKRSAQLQAIRGGGPDALGHIDALRALEGASALLARVEPKAVRDLKPKERSAAVAILGRIRDRVDVLDPPKGRGK